AVDDRIALALTTLFVDDDQDAIAIHRNELALVIANRINVTELDESIALGILRGLLADPGSRAADMERTHGKLRARLADGLRRNDTDRFAALHHTAGGQVAAVAEAAHAALRFARQHRTNLHPLDTGRLNRASQLFRDFLVYFDDHVVFVVALIFKRHAAHDAVAQRLDNFAGFDNRLDVYAVRSAAIVFSDDDVLRHVAKAACQVPRVRGLESGIGQTLAGAVR